VVGVLEGLSELRLLVGGEVGGDELGAGAPEVVDDAGR
jgi:hypothetical protein